jgi:phenylalanyl-tRNA synthetase beta chain
MKVPLSWLNEYVDLSGLSTKDLCDKLTASGVEVEGVETHGCAYEGFVAAEVRRCDAHPNADHLRVCTVFDGGKEFPVVCGAPNVAAGQKVCLAQAGARMPDGTVLKPAKIRGVVSTGMLCAADELGLGSDHSGILVLPPETIPGTPLAQLLPKPETVLELEITWNRPDCLSIIGIAREFSALLGRPLRMPATGFPEGGAPAGDLASVTVEAPDACPRYVARVIRGVQDGPSPDWMRRRLELCGVRAISLLVDVTNYVMLECGQPLPAFDRSRLAGQAIIVRRAAPGEKLRTLDEVDRVLDERTLLIADARAGVAVAGVMGGAESEIAAETASTGDVLLESALFAPPDIRRTAVRLNLHTESSRRFERGVDVDLADWASRRAAHLMTSLGGGTVAPGALDVDHRAPARPPVDLRFRRVREMIGVDIPDDGIVAILSSLGLEPVARDPEGATFRVPSWRRDIECDADLVEEVARIHGLDAIPDTAPFALAVPGVDDAPFRDLVRTGELLAGMGFSEVMHYSYLSAAELDAWDSRTPEARVVLPNPVSQDYAVMRDSLLPQLVQSIGRNMARQMESVALFELGRVFLPGNDGTPREETRLSMGLCGPVGRAALDRKRAVSNEEAAMWLKGAIERLVANLRAGRVEFTPAPHPGCQPGWSAAVKLNNREIGAIGLVSATLRHAWRVTAPIAVAEMRVEPLWANLRRIKSVKPVPGFPSVSRDLACIAPADLPQGDLAAAIRKAAPATLAGLRLFDVFSGKGIPEGKRSLGYTLEFRAPDRTLTDDEVNAAMAKLTAFLAEKLQVEVRAS